MNEATLRRIMKETVLETLEGLGFDVEDRQAIRKDWLFVRHLRTQRELLRQRVVISLISSLTPLVLWMMWQTLRGIY